MQKQSASHFLRESNCKLNEIFAMKIVGGLFTQYVRTKGEGVLLDQVHKHTINIISIFYKKYAYLTQEMIQKFCFTLCISFIYFVFPQIYETRTLMLLIKMKKCKLYTYFSVTFAVVFRKCSKNFVKWKRGKKKVRIRTRGRGRVRHFSLYVLCE